MKLKSARFSDLFGSSEYEFDTLPEWSITSNPVEVPIELKYHNGVVKLTQKLESGAEHTIYSQTLQTFIETLNIPLSDLETVLDLLRTKNIMQATLNSREQKK
jgi:hypothetical protein